MKKLFFFNCVLLIFGLSVFGQTSKSDLEQLRKEVGLSSPISIAQNDHDSFPVSKKVKIYLGIKHNKSAAKDFVNWVGKWNRINAAQYGQLQIVDNLADADIAAVQYQFGAAASVREESVHLKIGKVSAQDEKNDRFILQRVGNSNVKAESSVSTLRVPIYTYLIVRGQNSSWFVDYSRVDGTFYEENQFPERLLQSTIEDRLMKR